MNQSDTLLVGELVKLVPFSADRDPGSYAKWNRNRAYLHLAGAEPARHYSLKNIKQ
jgi:hypothetical protein